LNNHFESGNAINFELAFLNLLCAIYSNVFIQCIFSTVAYAREIVYAM